MGRVSGKLYGNFFTSKMSPWEEKLAWLAVGLRQARFFLPRTNFTVILSYLKPTAHSKIVFLYESTCYVLPFSCTHLAEDKAKIPEVNITYFLHSCGFFPVPSFYSCFKRHWNCLELHNSNIFRQVCYGLCNRCQFLNGYFNNCQFKLKIWFSRYFLNLASIDDLTCYKNSKI